MDNHFIKYILEEKINLSAACFTALKWNRYNEMSYVLYLLALYSLNKPKNKIKGNFEKESIPNLLKMLRDEELELGAEFFGNNIDFERALEEIADVAASLTGILAKVLKLNQERNN